MTRSKIFAVVFVIAAFLAALWMMRHIPHPLVLHINQHWHIMLVGEHENSSVKFNSSQFETLREDSANLWISGNGKITWHEHTLTVNDDGIGLDQHFISKSHPEADANIMFYPDGRVTKGKLQLN